jgi:hypothetical protein
MQHAAKCEPPAATRRDHLGGRQGEACAHLARSRFNGILRTGKRLGEQGSPGVSGALSIAAADSRRAGITPEGRSADTVVRAASNDLPPLRTRGTRLLRLPSVSDARGYLVWGQAGSTLPFEPKRF